MKKKLLFLILFPIFIFSQIDIVGGDDANISDYPWQVALTEQSGNWISAFCGGSIIDNYWILTAAHCVEDGFNGTLYIRAGSDVYYAQGGTSYSVDEIIIHPNYNTNTYNNDIALLKLNNPISFNSNRQPIMLICDEQISMGAQNTGVMATITGWGETETNNYNGTLQVAQVPITSTSNYGWGQIDSDMIMAGYPSGGYDTCQGDSGGPMVVRDIDDTEWMLVGITSWGNGCAEPGYPGVYSRVSYFLDWICTNTDGDVCANESDFCSGNIIYGCTDSTAENYNSNATTDDGSCNYTCDETISIEIIFDCWPEETGWSLTNENGNVILSENSGFGSSTMESICLSNGCFTFTITDSYGDGLGGSQWDSCNTDGSYEIYTNNEVLISSGGDFGSSISYNFCIDNTIYGCTNYLACNYNSDANENDGSCEYAVEGFDCNGNCLLDSDNDGICDDDEILGCTDPSACNYIVIATDDNNSCIYPENGYDCNGNCIEIITETQNCSCNENETVNYFEVYNEDMCTMYQLCECNCINDENNNGICDENEFEEIVGCTDQNADNYNNLADIDDDSCLYSQSIELQEGWNIWSTYINPLNTDMSDICSIINDDLIIVKDDEGNVYWPEYNLNSIGSISIGEGYQTKMSSYNILNLSGSLIPYNYEISIPSGWNIIAYLHQDSYNIENMMAPIVNNIVIIKDEEGNVYWPEYGLNSIENMNTGKGYQIKMLNPTFLQYPYLD